MGHAPLLGLFVAKSRRRPPGWYPPVQRRPPVLPSVIVVFPPARHFKSTYYTPTGDTLTATGRIFGLHQKEVKG